MVYCGKPSRACLECRIKRRKCDLSKPACYQCSRAGSRCSGYREQPFTFRDQTLETISKPQSLLKNSLHGNHLAGSEKSPRRQAATTKESKGWFHTNNPWGNISVSAEHMALPFFFYHYLPNTTGRALSHPDCVSILYTRATERGYLANLINAVGLVSLAYVRNAPSLTHVAGRIYTGALHHIRVALADPIEAASDQMLVAVMLLALYDTVAGHSDNSINSWDSHVDGVLALLELRGTGQLRNRVGRSIFFGLRTEVLVNCLDRRLRVPATLTTWMKEAHIIQRPQEVPAASLADIIVRACTILASLKESVTEYSNVSAYIWEILSVDEALESWANSLSEDYQYSRSSHPKIPPPTLFGEFDTYPGIDIVHTWNLQRCTRIILHQTLFEILSPNTDSLPLQPAISHSSQNQQLQISDKMVRESSSDIYSSVPYIFHFCDEPGRSDDIRGACILPLLWPLYVAGTTRTTTDAARQWVILHMQKIAEVTGIQGAKSLALGIQMGYFSPPLI